jgi:transposase
VKVYGELHDVPVIAVAPQFTTQECSGCGKRVYKALSQRTHVCPHCGLVLDRDHNAALNILAAALDGTGGHSGTDAAPRRVKRLGTGDRYCASGNGVQQVAWTNQEPPHSMWGVSEASSRQ